MKIYLIEVMDYDECMVINGFTTLEKAETYLEERYQEDKKRAEEAEEEHGYGPPVDSDTGKRYETWSGTYYIREMEIE